MAVKQAVDRSIEQVPIGRLLEWIHQHHREGRRIFTLVEISHETAIDPNTVEAFMSTLEETGSYDVIHQEFGETRWRVEGCVYDLDGWESTCWNVD
jgi:predicted transcriptional regulator of viral defense system